MRKMTGVLTAIFTFSLSVLICFVLLTFTVDKSKLLVSPVESSLLPAVSLCEAENLELHRTGDTIRIKGYLYNLTNGNSLEIYDFGNSCRIASAELRVWEDDSQLLTENDLSAELRQLIKQLDEHGAKQLGEPEDLSAMAKVEITGKLKRREEVGFGDSVFYINVKEIKQISPIVKVNLSDIIFRETEAKIIETR